VKVGASNCDISASKSNCCSRDGCGITGDSCSSGSTLPASAPVSSDCC